MHHFRVLRMREEVLDGVKVTKHRRVSKLRRLRISREPSPFRRGESVAIPVRLQRPNLARDLLRVK